MTDDLNPNGVELEFDYENGEHKANGRAEDESGRIAVWDDIPDVSSTDAPPITPIVEPLGIVKTGDRGSTVLWVGGDGQMKSRTGLEMAVAIAVGGEFLGMKCLKWKVLYVDHENPRAEVKKRLHQITGGYGAIPNLKIWGIWCDEEPPKYQSATLLDFAQKYKPVIMIDPFQDFHGQKENDPTDMIPVMNYILKLSIFSQNPVIYFHHPPLADSARGRGTGAIRGKSDVVIIHSLEDGEVKLRMDKNRFGAKYAYKVNIDWTNGGFKGEPYTPEPQTAEPKIDFQMLSDIIWQEPGINQTEICQKVGFNRIGVLEKLKLGVELGRWIAEKGPKNSTCYRAVYGGDL